jgi:EAL domain-containing protein (putative c-di-GMP-specific phosphodiesterase class I)
MYHAKRQHNGGWQLYADDMVDDAAGTAALEVDLHRAVRGHQLRLQYQPIVALDTGLLIGVEALVRWRHPTRGWLAPNSFVPMAERQGVIGELGRWVLSSACAQVQRWQEGLTDGRRLSVSVNLSPRQLTREPLADWVLGMLDRTGFDPAALVLEITEGALVDEASVPQLSTLAKHGIRIALDDFGTGYSSLRYLTRLPVDILKLDRCFVAELNGTKEGAAVAEAVIRLSDSLRLDTVAEGIENAAQAVELAALGFRVGQGYHFGRPLDPERIGCLIRAGGPWPAATGAEPR